MTKSTRRAVLAGLAVAPVAGAPTFAAAIQGIDPVLAAIAEWRELKTRVDASVAELERIERAYMAETTEERRLAMEAASEKAEEAGLRELRASDRVLEVEPTTAEGALALLEFTAQWVDDTVGYYFEDERDTAPARAIRAALAVLRSGPPIAAIDFHLG